MSEHDVEDLVEFSIRALDASSRSALDIRDGIASLFAYQGQHDCSFTHFRLMDLLLKREHTYVVPVVRQAASSRRACSDRGRRLRRDRTSRSASR